MLSVNRYCRLGTLTGILWRSVLLIALAHLRLYAQCNTPWLDRLNEIETADASFSQKIAVLSGLRDQYKMCHDDDSVYARMTHRLGDLYRLNGNFEKGISLTAEAIRVNKQETGPVEPSYLTNSYYNLGLYHNLLGLTSDAHLFYDSCIEIGYRYPHKMFIVLMALEKKAFMHFQSGDYEQSITISNHGLLLARKDGAPDLEAVLLIQKAQAEAEIDRIQEAEQDINRAIELLDQNHLAEYLPNAYSVYANVLSRSEQFDQATAYYLKAINLNLERNYKEQAARDLHDLAFLYDKQLDDRNHALLFYRRALKILETQQDPFMLATTHNNIGQLYWRNFEFDSALAQYQKGLMALPINFTDTDPAENPTPMQLRGVTNEYIPAALLWNKGDAWLGLYHQKRDTRFLKFAITTYRYGDRMVDQMRWKQQGEQSKLYWREKTKRWYSKAIQASYLLNDADQVFYFMEKSRAVLLNDRLAELGASHRLPPEEVAKEKALRVRCQSLASSLPSGDGDAMDGLWQAQNDLKTFIKTLEAKYPSYYSYKYDTVVSSLSDVRKKILMGGEAWVEFFSNGDTIYTLAITSDKTTLTKIYFQDHARIAKRITDLCSSRSRINSNFAEFHQLAYQYYKNVFKPLNLEAHRITISHDEYFLPFDLLPSDSTDQTSFLVRQHAFSYAYSATHILRTNLKDNASTRSLLAIAPVNYKSHLKMQQLNGADESVKKILSSFNDGVLLTGDAATKKSFLSQLPAFDIIHLYSHAMADSVGRESAIYFYDSALNLSELQNLEHLKTKLIVLFACNSGVGKSIKGEGIFSLARGFAAVGIPSTVSALWEIDNKATYCVAELFFQNLAKGHPSDVALQRAKLTMISDYGKEYELPYYWAGGVLIGKTDVYQSREAQFFSTGKAIVWVTTAVVLILLLLVKRKSLRTSSPRSM